MRVKPGVELSGLQYEMRKALIVADQVYTEFGQEMTVTSTSGGVHSAGSYHYYGYAFDTRTRDLSDGVAEEICARIRVALPMFYDVINEGTHLHIEFDVERASDFSVKKGF